MDNEVKLRVTLAGIHRRLIIILMSLFNRLLLARLSVTNIGGPEKETIIRIRWLVVIVCCYLLIVSPERLFRQDFVDAFMLCYISSNAFLYFIKPQRFKSFRFFSTLVVFDTLALSFCLIASRQLGSDLYLTYFLIVLIASFWKDFRWSLGFGVLISLLYTYLLFIGESLTAYAALRIPFLFIASVFYGYCTQIICTERTLREKAENELRNDFLTGLSNRRGFEERVKEETARARRYGRSLSLLMIDIDDFKMINDSFGHHWGDVVLQKVASVLKNGVREPDFVARIGGEEFVMLLPETDLKGAAQVADRIRMDVERCFVETPTGFIHVTVSVGTSSDCCRDDSDFAQVICNADKALYVAKRNGKNRVEECTGLFDA